jgi:type II secretory pathway pseudopilin PulG
MIFLEEPNIFGRPRTNLFRQSFQHHGNVEAGATLVETLVALAILMTVLIPVIGFMAVLAGNHQAMEKVQALNYAQHSLESELLDQAWSDSLYLPDERWSIERSVETDSTLVFIRVEVFRRGKPDPLVKLSTARLDYSDDKKRLNKVYHRLADEEGYTLVELLTVFGIAGFLFVMAMSVWLFGLGYFNQWSKNVQIVNKLHVTVHGLSEEIYRTREIRRIEDDRLELLA